MRPEEDSPRQYRDALSRHTVRPRGRDRATRAGRRWAVRAVRPRRRRESLPRDGPAASSAGPGGGRRGHGGQADADLARRDWLRRWREEGPAGLADRSSAPHRRPHALSAEEVASIVERRLASLHGPHRLAPACGRHRSTVYGVLRRAGLSRLAFVDRPTRQVVRYQRERPGELVHVDVKKLGRIPDGGGWRLLGRAEGRRDRRGLGYDYLHVAVDDASRLAFVQARPDERGETCAAFLDDALAFFAAYGVERVERVMTDNAFAYVHGRRFREVLAAAGARHRRTRPQTNGKVERFHRTLVEECAYARLYRTNAERLVALDDWLVRYNHDRPHSALGGRTPMAAVSNVGGKHS